jgi:hypothetical protein
MTTALRGEGDIDPRSSYTVCETADSPLCILVV